MSSRSVRGARGRQDAAVGHQAHCRGDLTIERTIAVQEPDLAADRRMRGGDRTSRMECVRLRQFCTQAIDFGEETTGVRTARQWSALHFRGDRPGHARR